MTTTPRLKNAAIALLASSGLLLTGGCNTIEAGGQPLPPTPTPSVSPTSPTPTPTATKSADQVAAEKKVAQAYAVKWGVFGGKRSVGDLSTVLANANGEFGHLQETIQYANQLRFMKLHLTGSWPVEIKGSKAAKSVKGRPQILVDVCEDNTKWVGVDSKGRTKLKSQDGMLSLRLSVQKWAFDGKWYVTAVKKGSVKC